jgi:hypothetical protein
MLLQGQGLTASEREQAKRPWSSLQPGLRASGMNVGKEIDEKNSGQPHLLTHAR